MSLKSNLKTLSLAALCWLFATGTAEAAIDGAQIFPQIKTFVKEGATLLSIIIGVGLFFVISWHPIKDLVDIRNERKDYGHLVMGIVAAGVVAIIVGYYVQQGLNQIV